MYKRKRYYRRSRRGTKRRKYSGLYKKRMASYKRPIRRIWRAIKRRPVPESKYIDENNTGRTFYLAASRNYTTGTDNLQHTFSTQTLGNFISNVQPGGANGYRNGCEIAPKSYKMWGNLRIGQLAWVNDYTLKNNDNTEFTFNNFIDAPPLRVRIIVIKFLQTTSGLVQTANNYWNDTNNTLAEVLNDITPNCRMFSAYDKEEQKRKKVLYDKTIILDPKVKNIQKFSIRLRLHGRCKYDNVGETDYAEDGQYVLFWLTDIFKSTNWYGIVPTYQSIFRYTDN